MKLYFAAPLNSNSERTFNEMLASKIEAIGFDVFLPQRDGAEPELPPYNAMSPAERFPLIFETDFRKVTESNVALFVLDGRVPDEGVCVELGLAHAHKTWHDQRKLLVGLLTDNRFSEPSIELNPMVGVPLDAIFTSVNDLLKFLEANSVASPSSPLAQ